MTFIPHATFRWLHRATNPPMGVHVQPGEKWRTRVLQQLHRTPGGSDIWIDVPEVYEDKPQESR